MAERDTSDAFDATGMKVLAVLVVYERRLDQAVAWPTLQRMLTRADSAMGDGLVLAHVLVYDNSAFPLAQPLGFVSDCTYLHDPCNGGTAAAYRLAARLGTSLGATWLLLLDHDTDIPPTILQTASAALTRSAPIRPAALLPWVLHGDKVVSPARITAFGTVVPLSPNSAVRAEWRLTGIASGSLLRVREFDELDRMPLGLWLDYVDHWIFARLAQRGAPVALIDCALQHDLSVTHIDRLGESRLDGLLAAESTFVASLPWLPRAVHPWRLFARALRVARARPRHAWTIVMHATHWRRNSIRMTGGPIVAVSVVMAVYNGRRFLAQQVESVVAQLQSHDELIVIDDASSDGSPEWLQRLGDSRVRIVRHPSNLGVLRSFEDGLRRARHDVVFLCDQDDVWLPGKRAAVVAEFERDPSVLIVISDAEVIDANDTVVASSFMATRHGFKGGFRHTLIRNRYLGCAMAVRRELIDAALPIPTDVPMHDMWLGALGSLLGRVRYIAHPLIRYRRHDGNVSPSHRQGWSRMLRWRLSLLRTVVHRVARIALGAHRPESRATPSHRLPD